MGVKVRRSGATARNARCMPGITGMIRAALFAGVAALLCGCGSWDIHSLTPAFFGSSDPKPPPADPDPEPDVATLIRANIGTLFDPSARARNISVTQPRHRLSGNGWTTCVKASITASGRPIGQKTYLVTITRGKVEDRRLAEAKDGCANEAFRAL